MKIIRSRKAALSLSMEAIVILIIAVVMLGLALAFVQGLFQDMGQKVKTAGDLGDLKIQPTESEPVVFTPNSIDVKVKRTADLLVGFYNPSTSNSYWKMEAFDDSGSVCGGQEDGASCFGTKILTMYNAGAFKAEKDSKVAWHIIFTPQSGSVEADQASKSYLMTVKFCSVASATASCTDRSEEFTKQLFMTIRQ